MADEHKHEHEHEHEHLEAPESLAPPPDELDAAGKSLSDALRISFAILKVIMIVLVVAFLASGFRTVDSGEKALVLRFGKLQRILEPGPHWIIPYPVDELVRIPVARKVNLPVDTFWFEQDREDILGEGAKPRRYFPDKLNPLQQGYCLTRSQQKPAQPYSVDLALSADQKPGAIDSQLRTTVQALPSLVEEAEGSDYNIVHARWLIIYQIEAVESFFKNVYVQDVVPGQIYFDIMKESIAPLLRSVVEDAVVDALVHYTIDEVLVSTDTIPLRVQQLAQRKLRDLNTGVRLASVQLVEVRWPKQVNDAFEAYFEAGQKSTTAISEAETYAENTLNEAAGRVARPLYKALQDPNTSEEQLEFLWSQAAGRAQDIIAQAKAYRTRVVASAEANAKYLLSILPEYEKRPELVQQRLYLDTMEQVLRNADEKFIVQPSDDLKGHELRVLVNRDPSLKGKQGP